MTKERSPARPPAGRRRRRSSGANPLKKMSLRLHATVAEAVRRLVDAGEVPSADAFIEEAIIGQLRERRRQKVYAAYAEAAADPDFMEEMDATDRAFDHAVADGLGGEPR